MQQEISFKNSIGTRLLKSAFGLYILVAFSITALQIASEYVRGKRAIITEAKDIEKTLRAGVTKALWDFNANQVQSILAGLGEINSIAGAKVTDKDGKVIATSGHVIDEDKEVDLYKTYNTDLNVNIIQLKSKNFYNKIYEHKFPLNFKDGDTSNLVGYGFIYVSEGAVVDRVKYSAALIVLNSLLKSLAFWLIFLFMTRRIVIKPLINFTKAVAAIDPSKPQTADHAIFKSLAKRQDEIAHLSRQFDDMMQSIGTNIMTIRDLNDGLEKKVKERTAALQEKSRDITMMLQNMRQGIFTILPDSQIHPEYSTYLEEILENNAIASQNPMDLLFKKTDMSLDNLNRLENAISICILEDEISFGINSHCFPREVVFTGSSGKRKVLEIDWQTITSSSDSDMAIVDKIMVVVRDVTSLRSLHEQAEKQKIEIEMIGQILKVGIENYCRFYQTSQKLLEENKQILNASELRRQDIDKLFINAHTIKGASRTYHFSYFTETVHLAEQRYVDLRANLKAHSITDLRQDLENSFKALAEYQHTYLGSLKEAMSPRNGNYVKQKRVLNAYFDLIKATDIHQIKDNRVKELLKQIDSLRYVNIKESLQSLAASMPKLATELGKAEPTIDLAIDKDLEASPETDELLHGIFVHLFRNSLDHGIETEVERRSKGKPASGLIRISMRESDGFLLIDFGDDGAGLKLEKLKLKATNPRLSSDEQIAQLIFQAGVSTTEKATDISGRGVGMDAVKSFIEKKGGTIEIAFAADKDEVGNRPFIFKMRIPIV